ncbi:hypothetical protein BCR33DRAFT_723137 [Rhizoclosmatium globosum]|uniref:MYND-type domain-containing protein n=1 Tax=Rhizoclosmatium globosum TaxID=329046 RepID=A0A1Y2BHF8_9FUNG|nr:hypothetical protein BCR33DRAFT_723137 [Rhizoclosmatium globosum]|eukprot:ORY33545.1 hypothetical protein BCR33DRAFT_723137 [Rhizoclosmatium globosum]
MNLSSHEFDARVENSSLVAFVDAMDYFGARTTTMPVLMESSLLGTQSSQSRRLFMAGFVTLLYQYSEIPKDVGLRLLEVIFSELKLPFSNGKNSYYFAHLLDLVAAIQFPQDDDEVCNAFLAAIRDEHNLIPVVNRLINDQLSAKKCSGHYCESIFGSLTNSFLTELNLRAETALSAIQTIQCARFGQCEFEANEALLASIKTFIEKNKSSPSQPFIKTMYTDFLTISTKQLKLCGRCMRVEDAATGEKFKKCASCKTVYCGRECQVQDWKTGGHKNVCGAKTENLKGMGDSRSSGSYQALIKLMLETVKNKRSDISMLLVEKRMTYKNLTVSVDLSGVTPTVDILTFEEMEAFVFGNGYCEPTAHTNQFGTLQLTNIPSESLDMRAFLVANFGFQPDDY